MAEYIEREAAIKDICSRLSNENGVYSVVKNLINHVPAADVREVKRGTWEYDSDNLPICSECGEIALQRIFVKVPHLIQDVRMVCSNFCPNCGANMRQKEEADHV